MELIKIDHKDSGILFSKQIIKNLFLYLSLGIIF